MKISVREAIGEAFGVLSPVQKILLVVGVLVVLGLLFFGGSMVSSFETRKLEREVTAAKDNAKRWEDTAAKREIEAAQFKEKIEFLESNLVENQKIARTQDEKLEKAAGVTSRARADVRRAAGVQSIPDTDTNDLCTKLAELGHGCE